MRTDPLRALADKVHKAHHQTAASASEMLTITLRAFGCSGGEVIVPNHGCHSVAAAVVRAGATPVFVDVGTTLILQADDVARAVSPLTRAVVVVDQYGLPADHNSIRDTLPIGTPLIADLAQSWDGRLDGAQSGVAADAVLMSFGPGKPISVGAGGAAFSNTPIDGVETGTLSDRFAVDIASAARFPSPLLERLGDAIDQADRAVRYRRHIVAQLAEALRGTSTSLTAVALTAVPSWTRVPLDAPDPTKVADLQCFGSLQYPHDISVSDLRMFADHPHRRVRRLDAATDRPLLLKIASEEPQ